MSQSTTATRWPWAARATARLTVTDDLPTPPLPEATASTRVEESSPQKVILRCCGWPPRSLLTIVWRCSSVIAPSSTRTPVTPGSGATASVTSRFRRSFIGHPGMVRRTPTVTRPDLSMVMSLTMSSSVMGLWISGSITWPRAL
jgi:hypothetical protein